MVQDYDHHKDVYKPEVIDSRLLSHNGNDFHIYLRLLKKKVITVVLNSEHDVKYTQLDKTRWRSVSRTTKIAEVEKAGQAGRARKAAGHRRRLPVEAEQLLAIRRARRRRVAGMRGDLADARRSDRAWAGSSSRSFAICRKRAWRTRCAPRAPR